MSGGERARLALAMLVWQRPQLLVLDEPTNHLDAATRDALADALAEFDGALLLVSHDRYLLRATVDAFLRVADGGAAPFDGDLDDYAQWLMHRPAADAPETGRGADTATVSRRDERRVAAEQRAQRAVQRKPLQQRLSTVERELAEVERRLAEIDTRLASPDGFRDGAAVAELGRERAALERQRVALEEQWLELGAELEALDAAD
jgi:ATP-binding cassette subfamily F protein 3